jgi:small-conductance mechanosensitive channel
MYFQEEKTTAVQEGIEEGLEASKETIQSVLEYTLLKVQGYQITVANVLTIVILYLVARIIIFLIYKGLGKYLKSRNGADEGRVNALLQIFKYLIYILFIIFALQVVEVNVSLLLAGSAALLVGLGFGLQNIFNDLISGIIILIEGNLKTTDIVELNGLLGRVESIGLRTSKVRSRDSVTMIIPNNKLVSDQVINWSHGNYITRYRVAVGVAYGSDLAKVKELLLQVMDEQETIVKSPKPLVRFVDFGNSSLDFELLFWSREIWWIEDLRSDIRFAIDAAFRQNGITIPFPQRDLHFKSTDIQLVPGQEV